MAFDGKVTIQTLLDTKKATTQAKGLGNTLKSGLAKGTKIATAGLTAIATAGTATAGAMVKATKATAEYGDDIDKNSQRLGLSYEAYQKWNYALKISGSSIQNVRIGMKTLTNQLGELRKGSSGAQENFQKLGLSLKDFEGKSREQSFEITVKALQDMKDETERATVANKLFGRSGQEMMPLLNSSKGSIDELMKQAEDYGMVMGDKAVKASAKFQDSLTTMQMTFTGLKNRMTAEFLPSLTKVTDGLSLIAQGKTEVGLKKIEDGVREFTTELNKMTPKLLQIGGTILKSLGKGLLDNLPTILNAGATIVGTILRGIVRALPILIRQLPIILKSVSEAFKNALGILGTSLPLALQPLVTVITTLVDLFNGLVGILYSNSMAATALRGAIIALAVAYASYTVATKLAAIATGILNAIMDVNPIFLMVTAVVALTSAFVALFNWTNGQQSQTERDIELLRQKRQAIDEERMAWERQREETAKRVENENSYYDRIQGFADRLKTLADAKGNVKKKDEEQVKMILGQLNDALGTEYKLVDGQIQNYRKLQDEINTTIQAKRTEALLATEEADYKKALDERTNAEKKVRDATKESKKANDEIKSSEQGILDARKRVIAINKALADPKITQAQKDALVRERSELAKYIQKTENDLVGLKKKQSEAKKTLNSAKSNLQNYYNTIIRYETALTAQSSKEYDKAVRVLGKKDSKFANASKDISTGIAKGLTSEKALSEIDKSVNKISKRLFDGVKKWWEIRSPSHKAEDKLGYHIGSGYGKGIVKGFNDVDPFSQLNAEIMTSAGKLQSAINTSLDIRSNMSELQDAVTQGMENANIQMKVGERDFARNVKGAMA